MAEYNGMAAAITIIFFLLCSSASVANYIATETLKSVAASKIQKILQFHRIIFALIATIRAVACLLIN
jgi:hypothetical protein